MASPFPGMDPYLEGEMWQEFHETFANTIRGKLIPQLRPKYTALLAKRYVLDQPVFGVLEPPERVIYPDVHVVQPGAMARPVVTASAGQMTADLAPTAELASPMIEEIPQLSVEIRDVAKRRLVTLIEILSPVNKRGQGAEDYGRRRWQILQTATHLLEIDLLANGQRINLVGQPPAAPYYVYLSRMERRPITQVWAISIRTPLPVIPVPLLPPDEDVTLDLQDALTACFDLVGYETLMDYAQPPPAGLGVADAEWVVQQLSQP